MPAKNSVPYTLEINEEQHKWIKEHPDIDIDMLLRQTLLNQMRKPAQKKAAEKAAKKAAKLQEIGQKVPPIQRG